MCGKHGARTGKEAEIRGREAPRVGMAEDARSCVPPAQACKDGSPAPASSGAARLLPPSPASRGQANGRDGMGGARGGAGWGARLARRCSPAPGPPVPLPPPQPPLLPPPTCIPLGGGAGPALSPPFSRPPAAGRTRFPLPLGACVIVRPEHGEVLREPVVATPAASLTLAHCSEAGVPPGPGGRPGRRAAWSVWMNEALSD